MAKIKRQNRNPHTENQATKRQPKSGELPKFRATIAKVYKKIVGILSLVAIVVTIIVGFFYFSPQLSVLPYIKLDPSNAFSTVFMVSNVGVLPLHELEFSCFVRDAKGASGAFLANDVFVMGRKIIMNPGESTKVPCVNTLQWSSLLTADMTIIVSYRPDYWPWPKIKSQRFVTKQNKDGTPVWIPETDSE